MDIKTKIPKEPVSSPEVSGSNNTNSKKSRLSTPCRGLINLRNRNFLRNEKAIRHALLVALSKRYFGIRAKSVFHAARVTAPTFYAHAKDVNDALNNCEAELEQDHIKLLQRTSRQEVAWTITLNFIEHNRDYFRATAKVNDFYLLARMLNNMQSTPSIPKDVNGESYNSYSFHAMGIIYFWITNDHFDKSRIESCVKKLMAIKVE